MVNHNHYTSLVLLALFVLGAFVVLGVLAVSGPFGPGQDVKGIVALTQSGLKVRGTENALSALETPQAIQAGQAAAVAQLTAMPPAQTATQLAADANNALSLYVGTQTTMADEAENQRLRIGATQTAIKNEIENQGLINLVTQSAIEDEQNNRRINNEATQVAIANSQYQDEIFIAATATAIAQNAVMEKAKGIVRITILILATVVISLWLAGYAILKMFRARTLEKFANARLVKEQRHLVEARPSHQGHNGHRPVDQSKITTIQVKRPGNLKDLPRAE